MIGYACLVSGLNKCIKPLLVKPGKGQMWLAAASVCTFTPRPKQDNTAIPWLARSGMSHPFLW